MCAFHIFFLRRFNKDHKWCQNKEKLGTRQRAKRVVSDSLGLVDFAFGLVNYVLNLTDGQVKIFRRIKITEVL